MGGRPRKPTKLLELNGAAKKNPKRITARAAEPQPEAGLGDPPECFTEGQRQCWADLIAVSPAGVLTRMDRPTAELLCRLWDRARRGETKASQESLLSSLFGKFGLSPSERARVMGQPRLPGPPGQGNTFLHLHKDPR